MTFSTFASPGVGLQGGGGSGGGGTASLPISGNGATITTSTPLINGTQTWNSGATTFTSLLLNVTDTASAAGSLLMDLQVGGSSRFNVGKTGSLKLGVSPTGTNQAGTNVIIAGSQGTGTGAGGSIIFQVAPAGSSGTAQNALATALTIGSDQNLTMASNGKIFFTGATSGIGWDTGSGVPSIRFGSAAEMLFNTTANYLTNNAGYYGWRSANTRLYSDANNQLDLRNGANAQTFRVYNTTDGTNSEFGKIAWSSNVLQIGTEKVGTGTARALELQTDGTTRLTIAANGTVTFAAGITAGGAVNAVGSNVNCGSSAAFVITSRGSLSSSSTGVFLLQNAAANDFDRLQFGGTTSSFPALKRSSTTLQARLADDSAFASVQGKLTTDTAYTAGDPTTTGYLVVYDSGGVAYKIPAVAV